MEESHSKQYEEYIFWSEDLRKNMFCKNFKAEYLLNKLEAEIQEKQ